MSNIQGYRELTDNETDMVNWLKTFELSIEKYVESTLKKEPSYDQGNIALGLTSIRQGFMWLVRGITKNN